MKAQHQIKFKRRRAEQPQPKTGSAKVTRGANTVDVTGAKVKVGERELKFARALSDSEKSVRDASLTSLRSWLEENGKDLQVSDIDRLWKALFYCVWMADKRPIITATISAIVSLFEVLGWPFVEGLFRCMIREWFGIDKHRVDKYYELINTALRRATERITESKINEEFVSEARVFLNVLDTCLWPRANKGGLGVALHVLDVYVDQIMQPLLQRGKDLPGNDVHMVYNLVMDKLYDMTGSSEAHLFALGKRIEQQVFHRLTDLVSNEKVGLKIKDRRDMVSRSSKRVFAIAADKSTSDDVRKGLYDLHAELKAFVSECDKAKAVDLKDQKECLNTIADKGSGQTNVQSPEQIGRSKLK